MLSRSLLYTTAYISASFLSTVNHILLYQHTTTHLNSHIKLYQKDMEKKTNGIRHSYKQGRFKETMEARIMKNMETRGMDTMEPRRMEIIEAKGMEKAGA